MASQNSTVNHMTNIVDVGPDGVGDNFFQVTADETIAFSGGRLTSFNKLLWTGNYSAAGITAIAMELINISPSEFLNLRPGINGGGTDPLALAWIAAVAGHMWCYRWLPLT